MQLDNHTIFQLVNSVAFMVLFLTVHECAHAAVAYWLGDDTASRQGRLTLDPTAHIDPVGTLLIPALNAASPVPIIGWAKPVPTNPVNFTRTFRGKRVTMAAGSALVAVAGPLSNLLMALVLAVALGLSLRFAELSAPVFKMLQNGVYMNVGLAVFNILPVPPLDGSWVVRWLLPTRHRDTYEAYGRYGYLALFGLVMFGGGILAYVFSPAHKAVVQFTAWVAGA
ncbi:MAG: site-2 protease family protein [Myxococcota bacterium]